MSDLYLNGGDFEHVAEYFAVCGLSDSPKPFDVSEILTNGEEIVLSESKCLDFSRYSTPIIDILLVNFSQNEEVPSGYQLLDKSVDGSPGCYLQSRSGDDLCICYRRGYDISPIGDIGLVDAEQRLKPNACNITHTVGDRPALISKKRFMPNANMYLSYSRLLKNYGVDELALTDICLIFKKKGERCPLGYKELPQKLYHSPMADDMHICYKKSFVKRYIATYQPEVLMCYHLPSLSTASASNANSVAAVADGSPSAETSAPQTNEPIFTSVDIGNLASFCLPWGAAIESWSVEQTPPGCVFFTFVVTNASYQKFHGSALTFYEPYDVSQLDRDRCYRLNVDPELVRIHDEEPGAPAAAGRGKGRAEVLHDAADLFTPEELRVIAGRQGVFFDTARIGDRVLGVTKTLCLVSRSVTTVSLKPLLQFLHSRCFGEAKPVPLERYLAFILGEIPIPDARSPCISVELDRYRLELQAPHKNSLTSSARIGDEGYALMLRHLGAELTINLMVQLLTEQKLLFVSVMPDLLVEIIQHLITLIQPLRWVLVYIPLIHMRCIHVIQSPSPYLIGVDSRFFEFFQLPAADAEEISVVDLDTRLFRPAASAAATVLPKGPHKRLRSALTHAEERLAALVKRINEETKVAGRTKAQEKFRGQVSQLGADIRSACYACMTELLQEYRDFLLPVTSKNRELLFDSEGFVKRASDRSSSRFYTTLVGTQLWADFVRDLNCISERTPELEAFDTAISRLRTPKGGRGHQHQDSVPSKNDSLLAETGSQVSNSSGGVGGGDAGSAASAPLHSSSCQHRSVSSLPDSLSGSSLSGRVSECSNSRRLTMQAPTGMLELDPLCADLPLSAFTWTQSGYFPEAINTALMDELCRRLGRVRADTLLVAERRTSKNGGQSSQQALEGSNWWDGGRGGETDFCPPMHHMAAPIGFGGPGGNGVAQALGVAKLNALLRRSQQETTCCLIAATKSRNVGGTAWAEHLLSEVYSLWFLLLPAFVTSLRQHLHSVSDNCSGVGDADKAASMTTMTEEEKEAEAIYRVRRFLFEVVSLCSRLWESSVRPLDQAFARVLIALLYEYGTSDKGVVSFWRERSLNALSYAMANELQRCLGHKLVSGDAVTSSGGSDQNEGDSCIDGSFNAASFEAQALSTPIQARPTQRASFTLGTDEPTTAVKTNGGVGGDVSKSLSNYSLPPLDSLAAEESKSVQEEKEEEEEEAGESNKSTKKTGGGSGWKSFAQASMRKLASLRVEYVNPEVVTLDSPASSSTPWSSAPREREVRSNSMAKQVSSPSIGYASFFGHPAGAGSTRLPRNMRPWEVSANRKTAASAPSSKIRGCEESSGRQLVETESTPVMDHLKEEEAALENAAPPNSTPGLTGSASWFQLLQRNLPAAATSFMSPNAVRRGSVATADTFDGSSLGLGEGPNSASAPFELEMAVLSSYQPPSWYSLAGSLAVGPPTDRVCLANPQVMKPASLSSTSGGGRRRMRSSHRRSRSSSMRASSQSLSRAKSPLLPPPLSRPPPLPPTLKNSPSASVPLLNLAASDDDRHARSESPPPASTKPPPPPPRRSETNPPPPPPPSPPPSIHELRVVFSTCTPCGACGRAVFDEEAMAEWVAAGDPPHAGALACPACHQPLLPRLTVRAIAITTPPASSAASSAHGLVELSVPLLSPLVLRRQVEALIGRGGDETETGGSGGNDAMGAKTLSSAGMLQGVGARRVLLWNLVYLLHRVGLPTHLLDALSTWLMDAQEEARRLGGGRRVLLGGNLTIARALSEVVLRPDLPVYVAARWDAFPRKATNTVTPLYRLLDSHNQNLVSGTGASTMLTPSNSVADLAGAASGEGSKEQQQQCAQEEVLTLVCDGLAYSNFDAAVSALNSMHRTGTSQTSALSTYRELLLLSARINGTSWQQLNKFDVAYINYLLVELQHQSEKSASGKSKQQLQHQQEQEVVKQWRAQGLLPVSATALACRCVFRNLSLN